MTKIAFVGDNHLADRIAAKPFTLEKRRSIIDHDAFDAELMAYINDSGTDHVVFLGDLVDWYSPENVEKAVSFLRSCTKPYSLTPGNHDYQIDLSLRPKFNDGKVHESTDETPLISKKRAVENWDAKGVETRSRKIRVGDISIYLMDSALQEISYEDQDWMMGDLATDTSAHRLVATHAPFPFVDENHEIYEANKNYFQRDFCDGFLNSISQSIERIYCGHLHVSEVFEKNSTELHIVNLADTHTEGSFDCVSFFETS